MLYLESKEELEVIPGKETHKRSKNSKLKQVVKEESAVKNGKSEETIEMPDAIPESKILGEIPVKRPRNPSNLTKDLEEAAKDKSQEGKSVSDLVDSSSKNKSPVGEDKLPKESGQNLEKLPRQNSPSNDTSLHNVNADEKSSKKVGKESPEDPLKLTKKPSQSDIKEKSNDNDSTMRKITGNLNEERKLNISEKGSDEKGVVYVKQTIESFRDSQHSMKLDEK